jgi:hypothetical protein
VAGPEEPSFGMGGTLPSFSLGGKSFDELTENVYKSFDNIGLPVREVMGATDALLEEYIGEIASIPAAVKGAKFAAKLPIAHPLLKGLAIVGASATAAGIAQVFGELGEDVYNGSPLDYNNALEEGVRTAKWDASGGLVLGALGTVTRKALAVAGIASKDDAVAAARKLMNKYGTDLTWYQTTGSALSSITEGIARAGLGGREILENVERRQLSALQRELDTFFTGTKTGEFGSELAEVNAKAQAALQAEVAPIYEAIYEIGEGIPVSLKAYREGAERQIVKKAGAMTTTKGSETNSYINQANNIILKLGDSSTMSLLNQNIQTLKKIKRSANSKKGMESGEGVDGAAYIQKEINKLNKIIDDAAQKLAPNVKKRLDDVNRKYATVKSRLSSKTMQVALLKDPSEVAKWVYRNPDKVKDFHKFLGQARNSGAIDKVGYDRILADFRSGYVKQKLKTEGSTMADLSGLLSKLGKADEMDKLKSVLGAPEANRLLVLLKAAKLTNQHAAGRMSLLVSSGQMNVAKGAFLGGMVVDDPITVLSVLSLPLLMAKASSSSKTMGQWLVMNKKMRSAIDAVDEAKIGLLANRALQWANSEEENKRTSARGLN